MRWARRSIVVEIVFVRNSPSPSLSLSLLFPSSPSRPASLSLSFAPVPSCPSPSPSTVGSSRYSIPVARQRFGGTIPPRQTRLGSILPNERREPSPPLFGAVEIRTGNRARTCIGLVSYACRSLLVSVQRWNVPFSLVIRFFRWTFFYNCDKSALISWSANLFFKARAGNTFFFF